MVDILYRDLVDVYEKIGATSKRLEMTDLLVSLLSKTPPKIVDKVVYLTQGKLYPDFIGLELGLAEKLIARAIAQAAGTTPQRVDAEYKTSGDIGLTAEKILSTAKQITLLDYTSRPGGELTVEGVYQTLEEIAKTSGEGSQNLKISLIVNLLKTASPLEARYLLRTVAGQLRLGVADMTIIDALAIAFGGGKKNRDAVERAYNLSSDLGLIAGEIVTNGLSSLKRFKPKVGMPIRPMLAERLASPQEILEKLGGHFTAEFKYDGERIQAHKKGSKVDLFSRRLERISNQYPDAQKLVAESISAREAIVEAEAVAVNTDTGDLLPFQELMHRRRKREVSAMMESYPIALFFFDILFSDGKDTALSPYPQRRAILQETVKVSDHAQVAESMGISTVKEFEDFFETAIEAGCEGLMCKSIAENSIYKAGARGWLWIKYKRDYSSELTDSLDLVVVGAFAGRGKRAGSYGALLVAAYEEKADLFQTVCKVGSGFTDEDIARLPEILEPYKRPHRHSRVDSKMQADVWFTPVIVLEVTGAEITLSPLHTCAFNFVREGSGMAIRFPRFTGKLRSDKTPEDATTVKEVIEMYKEQKKVIASKPIAHEGP